MKSLLKAIDICGLSQAGFAKLISENLPPEVAAPVSPQQIWNWINRDRIVPAQYCPTIEKLCDGSVRCEELNSTVNWAYLRTTQPTEKAL